MLQNNYLKKLSLHVVSTYGVCSTESISREGMQKGYSYYYMLYPLTTPPPSSTTSVYYVMRKVLLNIMNVLKRRFKCEIVLFILRSESLTL